MNYYIVEQEINERIRQLRADADADRKANGVRRPRRYGVRRGGHRAGLRIVRRAASA